MAPGLSLAITPVTLPGWHFIYGHPGGNSSTAAATQRNAPLPPASQANTGLDLLGETKRQTRVGVCRGTQRTKSKAYRLTTLADDLPRYLAAYTTTTTTTNHLLPSPYVHHRAHSIL